MHGVDLIIIGAYLVLMSLVGWWVAKKASRNAESYFLASKSLPWWIIGVAHGSSGVDITGTMWFVMMFFIYGVKGVWLLWIWPLFSVIFRMVYLGTWVRRSNVLTGAEWMRTRFGFSRGAELAYLSVVVYAMVHVVGFLCYAFRGIAEFTKPFFPWDFSYETYGTATLLTLVSLAPRFLLIAAMAVLGIVFFGPELGRLVAEKGKNAKFEEILPQVLSRGYVPVGFKGLLIAALLASFMSTFVSTVNSGAAYVVNDIYKRYLNPNAPARRHVTLGWIISSAVILLGIGFGFVTKDVHSITKWITSSLIPAFVVPNVLKWHWWRFNGYGFFAGMVSGTAGALIIPGLLGKRLHEVFIFLIILALSAVTSVILKFTWYDRLGPGEMYLAEEK